MTRGAAIGAALSLVALGAGVLAGCADRGPQPTPSASDVAPVSTPSATPTPTASAWDAALAEAAALPEDEAIGRVIIAAISSPNAKAAAKLVRSRHLGGIILMAGSLETADGVRALTSAVQSVGDERGVPVLIGTDEEGGEVSRLRGILPAMPAFMAAGALDASDTTAAAWAEHAAAMHELGITMDFAPVADVTMGVADPTIRTRSASSAPERAGRAVVAAAAGLAAGGVVPVAKHFPGHGSAKEDSHTSLSRVSLSLEKLEERDFVPFRRAVEAGLPTIMTGHLIVKEWGKRPATVNPRAYAYLREDLGFEGVAITDALNMEGITDVLAPGRIEPAALAAGADVVLFPTDVDKAISGIRKALASGDLTRERLNEAVARVTLLARNGAQQAVASSEKGTTAYSASAAVVAARDCSRLIKGAVGIVGGTDAQRKVLVRELREADVTVVSSAKADTTVRLLGGDTVGADADVVVALNGPWALEDSKARVYVAIWGRSGQQMDALATVLTEPGTAKGSWPVKLDLPYGECA